VQRNCWEVQKTERREVDVLSTGDKSGNLSSYPMSTPAYSAPPRSSDLHKMKKAAYVTVVEQPASKGLRFRYECEGRSAGSIPGASSTLENRTFPTIQVSGYQGRAVVVVSCVTSDAPHRPHPHNLVGKEGCKKGVCTMELTEAMSCSFPNLGIQCVKKKDIEESLVLRQQIRVDPFQTGFSHKTNPQNIDLNCIRLAFQVFLEGNEKGAFTFALKPVISDPIYDKKAKCDLTICRLTETSGPVAGGKEILLFCDKITKDDIQVRFFEEQQDGQVLWEAFGDFQPSDVHKQYGICFRTPRYKNLEIEQPVRVQLQLRRPSDGAVSESRPFEFIPLDAGRAYWSAKRLKTNYSVFNQILSLDQAAQRQQGDTVPAELKHKTPLARAPVMAGVFSGEGAEEAPQRQQLKPVAMPGGGIPAASALPIATPSLATVETPMVQDPPPGPPPQVPVRSPMRSSILTGVYDPMPAPHRPISDLSIMSDFSTLTGGGDNISIATRQSVNEILSLAEGSVFSDADTINLDSISVNSMLNMPGAGMVKEEPVEQVAPNGGGFRESLRHPMGSLTSVATVKEILPEPAAAASSLPPGGQMVQPVQDPTSSTNTTTPLPMDITEDLGQIYDDVMQCVYDDVDVKYDDLVQLGDASEAPVPPPRLRLSSVDAGVEKPLPGVPRNKIISKIEEKKNEIILQREKEAEKKRQLEDQKRKEREALEEQKRLEREEKERKKLEEKEKKRQEEEQKKAAKKREEEEKKAKLEDEAKLKQSLFQRLFQRSQSRTEQEEADSTVDNHNLPPPIPPHAKPASTNSASLSEMDAAQLGDLEQIIEGNSLEGPADLQRLDSLVTEFTSQFPPEPSESIVKS